MIDRVINTTNINEADSVILTVAYENGISFMGGTKNGPNKIIDCLNSNIELFDTDLLCEPAKKIKTALEKVDNLEKLSTQEATNKIAEEYSKILSKKKFIIMLGGEHTVSVGALKSIAEKEKPQDITILQIDAHQDLRDDNSDYSDDNNKYAHSCTMRRIHELGFNFVQVGIRTYSKYEYEYWQKNKDTIKVFDWNSRDKKRPNIKEIIKSIKTKKVYLTIDVDGFDPAHMPGTGTPVQGGLEWNYGLNLIKELLNKKEVIGADIVEVAPQQDSVITEFGAALLCYKILSYKHINKLK